MIILNELECLDYYTRFNNATVRIDCQIASLQSRSNLQNIFSIMDRNFSFSTFRLDSHDS
jgi:hypothetical protein